MFSIVVPLDAERLEQFTVTKRLYDEMPLKKEFIIPTRSNMEMYFKAHDLSKDVRLIPYKFDGGFNPSMALNLGVKHAKYDSVIITSPEVKPTTPVLKQLEPLRGRNVICQVGDEDENHKIVASLVHSGFRDDTPAMYFLAMFNKSDIEKINGWDEDFMNGYAYEDNDFGARWKRAELPFELHEEIQGVHQYHPRKETTPGGSNRNFAIYNRNNGSGISYCKNGLIKVI